jgi:hypothetical protein
MQAIFGVGPLGGLIGLVLGIWLVVRWRRKRQTAPAAGN